METQITFDTLRASLNHLTSKELQLLKTAIEQQLQKPFSELLDTEYMEQTRREVKQAISLEEARAILAKIPGSLSDTVIAEREERL